MHDSELKRAQLQDHIQQTAMKMEEDASKNKMYLEEIINENKSLR